MAHNDESTQKLLAEIATRLTTLAETNSCLLKDVLAEHKQDIHKFALLEYSHYYAESYSKKYDVASRYSTVVIFGSYAAFFAIWINIEKYVTNSDLYVLSAISVGLSVLVFCSFEVFQMILMAQTNFDHAEALEKMQKKYEACEYAGMFDSIAEANHAENRKILSTVKYWKPVLISTIIFGAFGVATLLRAISVSINWCNAFRALF